MMAITFISALHLGQTKGVDFIYFGTKARPRTFPGVDVDFLFTLRERFVAKFLRGRRVWMGGFPVLRRSLGNPRHLVAASLGPRGIQPISSNDLEPLRREVPGEFCEEVQGIEHMRVLLEVVRVGGVKQHASLERLIRDLLQRDRQQRDVLGQALLRRLVWSPENGI